MITLPDGEVYFTFADFAAEVGSERASRVWMMTDRPVDHWVDTRTGKTGRLISPVGLDDPRTFIFDATFLDELVKMARDLR